MATHDRDDAAGPRGAERDRREDARAVDLANDLLKDLVELDGTELQLAPEGDEVVVTFLRGTELLGTRRVPEPLAARTTRRLKVLADLGFTPRMQGQFTIALDVAGGGRARRTFEIERLVAGAGVPERLRIRPLGGADPSADPENTPIPERPFPGTPIGVVRSPVFQPKDRGWGPVDCEIHLDERFAPGLKGLEAFSHALVVTWMHRAGPFETTDLVRRPRGHEDLPVAGVFAQRNRARPNPIGISAVKIERVEGAIVAVKGLDAIDGTPVLDLKPYVPAFDRVENPRVPPWMNTVMRGYFDGDSDSDPDRERDGDDE